ncbi:MAG: hypothetical protein NUV45_08610 [Tepidanaerobacteraceae bacterium]|jgi:hypothetical protein|nr:hypothetical protein [Tepidanaerobacteraceae bacterium]
MAVVDIIVAAYLVGIIVVLGILSTIAYKKQVERGEITEDREETHA